MLVYEIGIVAGGTEGPRQRFRAELGEVGVIAVERLQATGAQGVITENELLVGRVQGLCRLTIE